MRSLESDNQLVIDAQVILNIDSFEEKTKNQPN